MTPKEEFEYSDVVDENNQFIRKATREEIHSKKLKHRFVSIFVFGADGKLLISKRSRFKVTDPGLYDVSAGGHVLSGEDYEPAAHRELKEELNIDVPLKRIGSHVVPAKKGTMFSELYTGSYNGEINFNKKEVESIFFASLEELDSIISEKNSSITLLSALKCYKERARK